MPELKKTLKMENSLTNTINYRFKYFLDLKNMNQKTFSDITGVDKKTVSNIARGEVTHPKADFFAALTQHFPELNLRWLLLGEGHPILQARQSGYPFLLEALRRIDGGINEVASAVGKNRKSVREVLSGVYTNKQIVDETRKYIEKHIEILKDLISRE